MKIPLKALPVNPLKTVSSVGSIEEEDTITLIPRDIKNHDHNRNEISCFFPKNYKATYPRLSKLESEKIKNIIEVKEIVDLIYN